MRIAAVDDKAIPLQALAEAVRAAAPDAQVLEFRNPADCLRSHDEHPFDVAFLDIDMPTMSGIELAHRLKTAHPTVNIVFATGFDEFAREAFELRSSGYLTKPITAEAVATELGDLRHPVAAGAAGAGDDADGRLAVRCFGSFAVFAGGRAVQFGRSKTLELLAFLVDRRGALCGNDQLQEVLWPGDPRAGSHRSYLRTLVADLRSTLERCGHADAIVKRRGALAVAPDRLSCDYYDFLDGVPAALNAYRGEYLAQFPWAAQTMRALSGAASASAQVTPEDARAASSLRSR